MIQAGLDIHYMFVAIWKTFVVVDNEEWMMYKETTNYKLLGAYVAKIIGYSTINFFFKNSLSLHIFRKKWKK